MENARRVRILFRAGILHADARRCANQNPIYPRWELFALSFLNVSLAVIFSGGAVLLSKEDMEQA